MKQGVARGDPRERQGPDLGDLMAKLGVQPLSFHERLGDTEP